MLLPVQISNERLYTAAVAKYTDATELTRDMLLDLIEKIVVHEATGTRGKNRKQEVMSTSNLSGVYPRKCYSLVSCP